MTVALMVGLGVLAGSFAALWWADGRQDIDRDRVRWRQRRLAAHGGRCPWSGRPGWSEPDVEWLLQCPRCDEVFVANGDRTLPEHEDGRSR